MEYLNGLYQEIANIIGIESTVKIFTQFKGQQVTFPVKLFSKDYISNKIEVEYNGNNVKQLAKKYGYSERWIREIVKTKKVANFQKQHC